MKSLRFNSSKNISKSSGKFMQINASIRKRNVSFDDKPTPLDFDSFIPWFCLELQVPKNIVVKRTNQAEYFQYGSKLTKDGTSKSSRSKSRCTKIKLNKSEYDDKLVSKLTKASFAASSTDFKDAIPITTFYDKRDCLVEIAVVGCPFPIHRKVIQGINLCLPFHLGLSKLSIRNGGLHQEIVYEIAKLLPHSNLTEICLDDSPVPQLNYSILLERPSQIKYLSLKRCDINNDECRKIALKLDLYGAAVKTLLVLDLTSNSISDDGAQALGEALKTNRYLLHLNLSGNCISDTGAGFLLRYLQEFPLSVDDIIEKRRRRMDFFKSRAIVYKKCLEEVKQAKLESKSKKNELANDIKPVKNSSPKSSRSLKKTEIIKKSFIIEETSIEDETDKKTKEIMGDFEDPFAEEFIIRKDDVVSATGNLILTSLNLAYNNLTLISIRKILEVLKYKSKIKSGLTTGLLRVVIDGNNIPTPCDELEAINLCFNKVILENESKTAFLNLSRSKSCNVPGKII